jgi:toxin ParE1/3/4
VNDYTFSKLAESDLQAILDYTVDKWGGEQAEIYLDGLVDCFKRIAKAPDLGRECDGLRPGMMRIEYGKHVVFLRRTRSGIRIGRVLHQKMLPSRHSFEGS